MIRKLTEDLTRQANLPATYTPSFDIAAVVSGEARLTDEQFLELYHQAPLTQLGNWAFGVVQRLHPQDYRTYVIDRNINYTNICTARCTFCAFKRNDPQAPDESHLPGVVEGDLPDLLAAAALRDVRSTALEVSVPHRDFDDWWQPFTRGVGPAGSYVSALDPQARDRLEQALRRRLPDGPFATTALAWAAWGRRSNADE